MSEKQQRSAPLQLLDLVWAKTNEGLPHSWERLNHAMSYALSLAIGSGMTFAVDDFATIWKSYRTSRWIGASDEWCYTLAVTVGNQSAVESYEAWKGRRPIIADDVTVNHYQTPLAMLHKSGARKRERLAVGFTLPRGEEGDTFMVTSFGEDYAVACSYSDAQRTKVKSRVKITAADVKAARKAKRAAKPAPESIH